MPSAIAASSHRKSTYRRFGRATCGGFPSRIMASGSIRIIRSGFLEYSSDFTHARSIPGPELAWPFVNASSNAREDGYGWNLNPDEVLRFTLRSQPTNPADPQPGATTSCILL